MSFHFCLFSILHQPLSKWRDLHSSWHLHLLCGVDWNAMWNWWVNGWYSIWMLYIIWQPGNQSGLHPTLACEVHLSPQNTLEIFCSWQRRCNMAEQEAVGLLCGYRVISHLLRGMYRHVMRAACVWNLTFVVWNNANAPILYIGIGWKNIVCV